MINVLFDQYQRYNNARKIIDGLRVNNETFRILEVGANEHRNLEKFLPLDNITYLDIQLPEELVGQPNYILGDATNMSFSNNEYDVIVALDVFEHIPFDKRNQFIDELYRVSSKICIITAPFQSQQTIAAESRVNTVYKSLFNKNFIWLEEHMENGLPNKDLLRDYLKARNINFKMIGHGNIDLWERLMTIHFFAAKTPELGLYREEIDKFYNSNIFDYDYTDDSYRMIVILEKDRKCPVIKNSTKGIPLPTLLKLEYLENEFYHLSSLLNKNNNITNNSSKVKDKAQIFIDSGQGFSESQSSNFPINDNEATNHISINLQSYQEINSIRIDPSNYSGVFKVEILELIGSSGRSLDFQVTGNFSQLSHDMHDVYLFEIDDPNISLTFETPSQVSILKLNITRLTLSEVTKELGYLLSSKEKRIMSMDDNYIQQIKLNENLQNKLEQLNDEIQQLKSINKHQSSKSEELFEKLTLTIREREALTKKNRDDEKEKQALTKRIEDEEIEKQALTERLLAKERELKDIYNSKAWALVMRLRKILGK